MKLTDGSLAVYEAVQSTVLPLREDKRLVLHFLGRDSTFLMNIAVLDFWPTAGCLPQKKVVSFLSHFLPLVALVHLAWIAETCWFCFLIHCHVMPCTVLAIQPGTGFSFDDSYLICDLNIPSVLLISVFILSLTFSVNAPKLQSHCSIA